MKIFSSDDIRAIDAQTIANEGISSHDLIHRVAESAANEIMSRWRPSHHFVVFAGPGNNGADALAIAQVLMRHDYRPIVYLFNIGGDKISPDCRLCRNEFRSEFPSAEFYEVTETSFAPPHLNEQSIVIDGLFGNGLREPLKGGFKAMVRFINESKATVVAIDVPSGMFGDLASQAVPRDTIHATLTLCVQFPRVSFFLADNAELVGEWKVLDIGLSHEAIQKTHSKFHYVETAEVKRLIKRRPEFSSKNDFGNACLIAGRYGMMGAALLACRGAMRSGAGKVTLYAPQCAYEIIQSAAPEVLFEVSHEDKLTISDINLHHNFDGIGIGPGLGTHDRTVDAVDSFIKNSTKPLVIDADAINCIAKNPLLLGSIPKQSVLTPHTGEFDRLFGTHTSAEARLLKAVEMAHYYGFHILLKGRYTALVRHDGRIYFNSSGCSALATAGSGDVLTGLITGLMAQGYKPDVSALLGAFIHGLAGEIAAKQEGEFSVTASDIAANIGKAYSQILI